jgi:hypothetical protein
MIKLEIDNELLEKLELTPNQYFLAKIVAEKDKNVFEKYCQIQNNEDIIINDLYKLYQKGYIEVDPEETGLYNFDFEGIKVNLFENKKKLSSNEFEDFINGWYALFPKGIKSGGYLVRSGKSDCAKKLQKFMKEHPTYTKEIIIQATKNYIIHCKNNGYGYMKLATNFISKDGVSVLEGECENVINKSSNSIEIDKPNGITYL